RPPAQPCLLDHVLGVGPYPQHAVTEAEQTRTEGLEGFLLAHRCHGASPSRRFLCVDGRRVAPVTGDPRTGLPGRGRAPRAPGVLVAQVSLGDLADVVADQRFGEPRLGDALGLAE